jgi:cytochrome b pre-mRNA-processing protein 3
MFADLDRAVREMGATDVGVGRHVKAMARGFYGRIVAYEQGLETGDEGLEDALRRNLFGTAAPPAPAQLAAAARYLRRQAVALAAVPVASLVAGEVTFAPLDETPS